MNIKDKIACSFSVGSPLQCPDSLIRPFLQTFLVLVVGEVEKSDISSCSESGHEPWALPGPALLSGRCFCVLGRCSVPPEHGACWSAWPLCMVVFWVGSDCQGSCVVVSLMSTFSGPFLSPHVVWLHCQFGYISDEVEITAFPHFVLGRGLVSVRLSLPRFHHAWVCLTRDSVLVTLGLVLSPPKSQLVTSKLNLMLWFLLWTPVDLFSERLRFHKHLSCVL